MGAASNKLLYQTQLSQLTLLEISTTMKPTSLLKSLRTLGAIALFSLVAGATMQQSAQAQTTRATQTCQQSATKAPKTVANRTANSDTVVDIAARNSSFTTLVQAVKAAGLTETLSSNGPFTVFAPTNEAFAALPKGTLEKLLKPENKKTLQKILTYHVVSGNVLSKDLRSGRVTTVEGGRVAVQVRHGRNGGIRVNRSTVVATDIRGTNGVVHVIDRVLLPPNLKL
ncbi:beta-Ig-H3/fasciclin [Leptolyngbya sp. NIES-3755]|nr:beta-Ig-H3/fasciclin [Leptolyngbya sp. NIES-3755]